MTSRIKKATEYSDRGKETMIPEEEDPLVETDLSSNNEKRWPEGSPSEKALRGRRIIIRSEVRREQKPEPSHRYREPSKMDRRSRLTEEPRTGSSTSDRTWDEYNEDTVEALQQQTCKDVCHLKAPAGPTAETDEEESSDGRNKGGRTLNRGSRGNWSESPSTVRQPYGERIGRETVWKALHQISHSPFSKEIESARLPRNFSAPTYVMYDGKADPVGHISHYRQSMAIHLGNNALMCRMFPSSLGPMSLRWFNRLPHSSIFSWNELAEAFVSRFITNSRKPKEFASLMSMRMKDSESLKNYSARYWEVYNEVDGGTEDMAMKTFKEGLHPESELRHSLSKRSARNMRDLMSRIEQYVRVEEDRARTGALSAQKSTPKKAQQYGAKKGRNTAKESCPFSTTERSRRGSVMSKKPRMDYPENEQQIFFSDEDLRDVQTPHDDPLVIKLRIGDSDVKRVLVDQGSCSEIMYPDLFHGLGLKQTDLQPYDAPLVGFSGESIRPMGRITLNVHTGPISLETEFVVIDVPSPYTAIMGRRWLHRLKAVPSSFHQKLRFPTDFGIMEIKGDQVASKQCIMAALEKARDTHTETYSSCEELDTVIFSSDPEKYFKIGRELSPGNRTELIDFLVGNVDVFAWDPYEVPGVDPNYIEHRLNTDPHSKPVQQKARRSAPVHAEAVQKEVEKLLQAGAIREIQYPTWLSNTVVVKKKNGKWRVCVDFTNLNQACPKDPFPLPKIDQLVDATAGHDRMSFLDAFQGLSQDHLKDLTETFRVLRLHKLRLNASKCVFGVGSGKFLGFMVSHRGIEVNPDQIKVIQELKAPRTHKEVQRLTGEPLFLYLAVSDRAVSAVLIRIKDTVQCPVYYASKTMTEAETHYPPLEKVGLALITAADKLPQYFQAHTVYLVTQYPVQAMFNKADFTGRIWKWGAKISALGANQRPKKTRPTDTGWWKVYVDGASNSKGSGTGVVIITPDETVIEQSIRLNFKASNNEAEYEAVLAGLKSAKTLGARRLIVYCDSLLVASQISGEYMARDERMSAYLLKVQTAMTDFETVKIEQIGRNLNNHADALATLASVLSADFKRFIPIETLTTPSIDQPANYVNAITVGPCWMDPYVTYLKEGVLPEQKKEAEIIRRKAARFWLSKDLKLYRRSFSGPYLLCVHPDIIEDLLYEIHEGICGSHTGGRSLAHRALTQGYWWPYMQKDAVDYVRKCDKCQRFSHSVHQPAGELQPLVSPWPFAQWGMDLVGPLPKATGNRRWLIVATDYFTKWVEAEPLANIRDRDSIKFVWKNIITRFGIPKTIISDNGTQFTSKPFTKYCSELGIKNVYSSPAYPQSNGQAEASNKTVLDGIKKRLEDAKGRWVEELPNVLWTFRTTPRRSTGETPFSLAYGSEAVIPLEIGLPTLRTSEWEPTRNDLAQSQALDLLEERREQAMIRLASYQQQLKKGYNKNIRPRSFQQGDLVLRKVLGNTKNPTDGKLGPNWEGPYRVRFVTGTGAYHLEDLNSFTLASAMECQQSSEVFPLVHIPFLPVKKKKKKGG
uniref:RNA-directed DNA polymerase n=1 Tax=Fagus sylvatica TaxID=28930 RepID=A0A2N9FAE8_FAGSY